MGNLLSLRNIRSHEDRRPAARKDIVHGILPTSRIHVNANHSRSLSRQMECDLFSYA